MLLGILDWAVFFANTHWINEGVADQQLRRVRRVSDDATQELILAVVPDIEARDSASGGA